MLICVLLFILTLAWALRLIFYPFNDMQAFTVGSYSHHQSRLLIRNNKARSATIEYASQIDGTTNSSWTRMAEDILTVSTDFTVIIDLNDLRPATIYLARLVLDGQVTSSEVKWKTLPDPSNSVDVRFTFGSSIFRWWWKGLTGFQTVTELKPDFMFFLGDFIYADRPMWIGGSKEIYDSFYREVFADPYFSKVAAEVPIYYMFGDHEIAEKWDSGTGPEIYRNAIAAWSEYNGNTNPDPFRKGEHYFTLATGAIDAFVMDVRSHRSLIKDVDNVSKTMLGKSQLKDVETWLLNSTATFKFLVSTVTWSENFDNDDGWASYLTERNTLLDWIKQNNISGVVLLSAGYHSSAVIQLRDGIYEISVSPLDAFATTLAATNEPDRLLWAQGARHYVGLIKTDVTANPAVLSVTVYDSEKKEGDRSLPVYNHDFTLQNGKLVE